MAAHRHQWHGLWYHWGPFGDQSVHVHPCHDGRCSLHVLVGQGRECSGSNRNDHAVHCWVANRWKFIKTVVRAPKSDQETP